MSTLSFADTTERARLADCNPVSIFGRTQRALARLAVRSRRTAEARHAEQILQSLPDRLLKDMGITRGDISARVNGRWAE
jgi:uncharacterized protein YjiS (DUF1127 family)